MHGEELTLREPLTWGWSWAVFLRGVVSPQSPSTSQPEWIREAWNTPCPGFTPIQEVLLFTPPQHFLKALLIMGVSGILIAWLPCMLFI